MSGISKQALNKQRSTIFAVINKFSFQLLEKLQQKIGNITPYKKLTQLTIPLIQNIGNRKEVRGHRGM